MRRIRSSYSDHSLPHEQLARLEMLLPQSVHPDSYELQAYALAFAEWYRNDIFQLEHEWELLIAALNQAWQRAAYDIVVRFVDALAYPIMRFCSFAEAEWIMHIGIEASNYLQDTQHVASFLSHRGYLLCAQGNYWQGRLLWYEALHLVDFSNATSLLWKPLYSFAYIVDILGSYAEAQRFAEKVTAQLCGSTSDATDSMAVALFVRGFYARLTNDAEQAYTDLSASLRCIARMTDCTTHASIPAPHQVFLLAVQTELARVCDDYTRAQQLAESTLSFAQIAQDRYTIAALLLDQGLFTCTQDQLADTEAVLSRLQLIIPYIEIPHVHACHHFLAYNVANASIRRGEYSQAIVYDALSAREIEVLRLVADGLSNHEIASKLVVTQGTVKKHLEHIYNKLDVCSRTSALARAKVLRILP